LTKPKSSITASVDYNITTEISSAVLNNETCTQTFSVPILLDCSCKYNL